MQEGGIEMKNKLQKEERWIAMYLRVSTHGQFEKGYGIGDQEIQCRKYLDLYYPDSKIKIYKEEGKSAKNLERPKMQEMLKDLRGNKIRVIIAFKLDRLTRNVPDTYKLISEVLDYDCTLVAVVDRLDISSANGRMLVGILSIIAQWEREVISERTIAALVEMAREGKYPLCNSPFGWSKDQNKKLHVKEEEAQILNSLCDMYLEGYSLEEMRVIIKEKYNFTRTPTNMKKLLLREENFGHWNFRGEVYTDIFPPIFTKDKYKMLREQLLHREIHRNERKRYYFHRLVYCKCGKRCHHEATRKKTKIFYYYHCPECKVRFNQNKLTDAVINEILLYIREHKVNNQIEAINKSIIENKEAMETLFHEYQVRKTLDKDNYNFTLKQLLKREKSLKKELKKMQLNEIDQFKALSYEEKHDYIHTYVSKIYMDPERKEPITIEYKSDKVTNLK